MAVIVCPGGGYRILSMDTEGYDVCRWLNSVGVTAVLLKYRLQPYGDTGGVKVPLVDAQRAVRIVRSRARRLRVRPDRIGMVGFSAGGHLSCMTATHWDLGNPKAVDPLERLSSRPDFIMPIYTAARDDVLSKVSIDTPPAFIVTATDDFLADHNVALFNTLRTFEVPAELHFFQKGGHGFGLGPQGDAVANWPLLAAAWLQEVVAPMAPFAPSAPQRPVPKEKGFHKRITCGTARSFQDRAGHVWEPDSAYVKKGGKVNRGAIRVGNTTMPDLYRTERFGADTIRIPTPNGAYRVSLHFAETYEGVTKAGQRVFDIALQGKTVLAGFDPLKAAGGKGRRAVVKRFAVTVKNKALVIGLRPVKESTLINAIEIAPRA